MRLAITFALIVAVGIAVNTGEALAGQETGGIEGMVFEDFNGDGVQDPDEERLVRQVTLRAGGTEVQTADSFNGQYSMTDIPAGDYTIEVTLANESVLCSGGPFGFTPLPPPGCHTDADDPWVATTAADVPVTISADTVERVDFGLQSTGDSFTGLAIVGDDHAPDGTLVEAVFEGEVCGSTTVEDGWFSLVYSNSIGQAGCAAEGDTTGFTLNGDVAQLDGPFDRFMTVRHLILMADLAWYWAEGLTGTVVLEEGQEVQARVAGVDCGKATVETTFGGAGELVGFSRLIVPSSQLSSGCGVSGGIVEFVSGESVAGTATWEPGIHQIELSQIGPADLPDGGGEPSAKSDLPWIAFVGLILALTGGAALTTGLAGRSRDLPG